MFLISRSAQSSFTMVANSGSPFSSTWMIAGLRPTKVGPSWRKLWPSILPTTLKNLLSTNDSAVDGVKWSGSPSKIAVCPVPPKRGETNIFFTYFSHTFYFGCKCMCIMYTQSILNSHIQWYTVHTQVQAEAQLGFGHHCGHEVSLDAKPNSHITYNKKHVIR